LFNLRITTMQALLQHILSPSQLTETCSKNSVDDLKALLSPEKQNNKKEELGRIL